MCSFDDVQNLCRVIKEAVELKCSDGAESDMIEGEEQRNTSWKLLVFRHRTRPSLRVLLVVTADIVPIV